jgi:hypothetical protein
VVSELPCRFSLVAAQEYQENGTRVRGTPKADGLPYAGVIIGPDLRYDVKSGTLRFDRTNYCDPTAANNMPRRGIKFTEEILRLVQNIYVVLLTRGMLGAYVYVCDEPLRERLRPFLSNPALIPE